MTRYPVKLRRPNESDELAWGAGKKWKLDDTPEVKSIIINEKDDLTCVLHMIMCKSYAPAAVYERNFKRRRMHGNGEPSITYLSYLAGSKFSTGVSQPVNDSGT